MSDERREIMERAYAAIADRADIEKALQERARSAESGWVAPQPSPAAPVRQRAPVDNWQRRMEAIVDRKLGEVAEGVGQALGKVRAELRQELSERELRLAGDLGDEVWELAKEERARIREEIETPLTELMMGLEQRIAVLEEQLAEARAAPGPRLVHDAA